MPHDICERTFLFAVRIVNLCRTLSDRAATNEARLLSSQLFRSGTSVGANVEEAQSSQSKPDYIAKLSIACKEARETRYWLRLLEAAGILQSDRLHDITDEANQLIAILTTIIKKCRASLPK
ncbi:four helix bundle protein [Ereboglobus sp. PH5-10]|uniref:Four helix bundle protein n=2 Tax=Opitutaceae TaxID=134623 RepID=A0A2U8E6S8_9BACT|nr:MULTISPECIES: four helix bundle protein [Ereboglobus]AWI10629.1 four helix bundle protein [Ereboglobus luteus]MDF9828490.1 four helix bundle protein [Ereboglobus sp. PH5-10]